MIQAALLLFSCLPAQEAAAPDPAEIDLETLRIAARMIGLEYDEHELELALRGVRRNLGSYGRLRAVDVPNDLAPAVTFSPLVPGVTVRALELDPAPIPLPEVSRPDDLAQLHYADIPTLAALVRAREVSCTELCELSLARLKALDGDLHCVITLTEERALAQAARLDAELARGEWRGLLHGIPWGAKDLLAVRGYPTTWGAKPFEEQVLDLDATVVRKLDEAGAVLVAKLTLGALAMGDVWYGGTTRNPWRLEQGSSGSSAGSAAATAAGCVPFAIGSETYGSIVSPSTRCGNSALRPTFGRVSRHGAMALSWSMDKLGPLCRSVTDAAIVFAAIQGPDPADASTVDRPFALSGPVDVKGWKVGYHAAGFERSEADRRTLEELRALGCELVPVELPDYPLDAMRIILDAESACAFDELTRGGRDDELVQQVENAWPNFFRRSRFVPAVEYLRANRVRTRLMQDLHAALEGVDLYVHPSFDESLLMTNLTGHPTVVAPNGFRENGTPRSICFTGQLYGEARLLAFVQAWQRTTDYHTRHPDL